MCLKKVIKMSIKENEMLPQSTLFEYTDQKINSFELSKVIKEKKIVIFVILAKKIPTYFFYKPYRTTFY